MFCMAVLISFFLCPGREAKKATAETPQVWTCSYSGEQNARNRWQQESRECSLAQPAVCREWEWKDEEMKPCYSYHKASKETWVIPQCTCDTSTYCKRKGKKILPNMLQGMTYSTLTFSFISVTYHYQVTNKIQFPWWSIAILIIWTPYLKTSNGRQTNLWGFLKKFLFGVLMCSYREENFLECAKIKVNKKGIIWGKLLANEMVQESTQTFVVTHSI